MTTGLLWGALALIVLAFLWLRGGTTSGTEARKLVAEGARLLDVRSVGEFEGGHLESARNIPVHELEGRAAELEPRDAPIVVYCQSGVRSAQAKRTLARLGFSQVHNLGGIGNW